MGVRLNLNVDDDIPEMLTALAGGERKRGDKVSEIVRDLYLIRNRAPGGSQNDRIEHELAGIAGRLTELDRRQAGAEGKLHTVEDRLHTVERELAAVIAARA